MIGEPPAGLVQGIRRELPWRRIAIVGSIAGLGLGIAYAVTSHDSRPGDISTASTMTLVGSSGAPAPETSPANTPPPDPANAAPSAPASTNVAAARPPGTAANVPATTTTPGATAAPKAGATAKTRSAMDERLDWLERDLKEKPAPAKPKREHPDFPAIGLGAEQ
jgi:hypothetical protein